MATSNLGKTLFYCPSELKHGTNGDLGFVMRQNDNLTTGFLPGDPTVIETLIVENVNGSDPPGGTDAPRPALDGDIQQSLSQILLAGDARDLGLDAGTYFTKPAYTADYVNGNIGATTRPLFPRHSNKKSINLLFADGHCEMMAWKDFTDKSAGYYKFARLMDPRK